MDQFANAERTHKVAEWDFGPAAAREMFTLHLTPEPPAPARHYAMTHDQALQLALRIAHRLRG